MKMFESDPNFPEDKNKKSELEDFTQPLTTDSELNKSDPDSLRAFQLKEQQEADMVPVTFEVQLSKIDKELKEADMRVMENINHVLHLNTGREPDVIEHCKASAVFFQRKMDTMAVAKEIVLRQILLKEKSRIQVDEFNLQMKKNREEERRISENGSNG